MILPKSLKFVVFQMVWLHFLSISHMNLLSVYFKLRAQAWLWKPETCANLQIQNEIIKLGRCAENQNGNLRWHLPLGVGPAPPPLMAQISRHFFTPLFSFAIESYIYETDFTLGLSQIQRQKTKCHLIALLPINMHS